MMLGLGERSLLEPTLRKPSRRCSSPKVTVSISGNPNVTSCQEFHCSVLRFLRGSKSIGCRNIENECSSELETRTLCFQVAAFDTFYQHSLIF